EGDGSVGGRGVDGLVRSRVGPREEVLAERTSCDSGFRRRIGGQRYRKNPEIRSVGQDQGGGVGGQVNAVFEQVTEAVGIISATAVMPMSADPGHFLVGEHSRRS